METKQVKMTKVIKFSTRATLRDLGKYTGVMPAKLAEKAQALGIACEEPQIWQYTGSDGNPDTEFLLDICVPVSSFSGDPGEFSFYELPAISCLSEMHHGAWMDMETTYQKLMEEMWEKSMHFSSISREIYITCDFINQQNCITEVQAVLK